MPMVNFHAARVQNPDDFLDAKGAWATITIKPGIELVTGKLKSDGMSGSMTAQSYRFDKDKFTVDQAKKWLKKHKVKTVLFEPAKEEVKESVTMMADIAAKVTEKCWGSIFAKKKRRNEMKEAKGDTVAVSNGSLYNMKGSYEDLRDKVRKAVTDSQNYGKYPEIVSTFPSKVFVCTDDNRYFVIDWSLANGEVQLGTVTEIERQVKFIIKEMAERAKWELLGFVYEEKREITHVGDVPKEKKEQIVNLDRKALVDGLAASVISGLLEGGPGSGNWGHKGRPGHLGGSIGGRGGGISAHVTGGGVGVPHQANLGGGLKGTIAVTKQTKAAGNLPSMSADWKAELAAFKARKEAGGKGGGGVSPHMVKAGVHASTFYDKAGGLKTAAYKKLTDNQKTAVLSHGVQKYTEKYVPKAKQAGMSATALSANKKVGALEGMRRAAISKAKDFKRNASVSLGGLRAQNLSAGRGAMHIAISLQQQAVRVGGTMKVQVAKTVAVGMGAARAAGAGPGGGGR